MNRIKKLLTSGAAIALAFAFSTSAMGAIIECPEEAARQVTLEYSDGTVSCGYYGSTPPSEGSFLTGLGYVQIDKIDGEPWLPSTYITDITFDGSALTSGTISLMAGLENVLLVFKFGSGGISPDWISFWITTGAETWVADWSVDPDRQALSHVTLYRAVPEPTTVALLGLGLVAVGAFRLRRRKI
jgi:hypothetical protein